MARDDLPAGLLGNDAAPAEGPPKGETGIVTQQAFGRGWASFVDEMEYVPELAWPSSVIAYHRMRSDSQVEALHTGTSQPVREFRWSIDPNKADTKIVEQAAADLGLPIRGEEDEAIPRARNSFDFDTFLADALLSMLYGHFHFEVVGDTVEAQEWRMDRLSPRHPRTIADFKQSQNGDLEAIRQNIAPWGQLPPPIPGFKLIDFVWRSEAGSLVGRSLLRSIYREWMVKDRTIRVAAINLERGAGVPVVEGPPGASDKQIADLAELARQFKVAEGGGGAIPFGSKLTLVGGAIPEAINLLKYCDECMARVWALMLVQLGMTQTGNRALGAEFAIYAARAQRAIAKWIATRVNRFLDNYAEWNDPFAAYAPLLHYEQSKPDSMSITDFVALMDAGALIADPELEAWLRAEHGLPKWPQGLARPKPEAEGGEGDGQGGGTLPSSTRDPTSEAPTLAKGASANPTHIEREFNGIRASLTLPDRPMRRSPNDGEIRAAVDFAGLDAAHSTASNKLVQAFLGEIIPQQAKEVGDAIRSLPALSRTAAASLRLAPIGEDVLHQHLLEAAKSGVATAARELEAQGVAAVRPDEAMLAARIADQASAMAALNANGVSLAAQRKAQSLISTATAGRTPEQIAAEVESHLLGMRHSWTREQLRGAVTMAQNQGRIATFTESRGETEPTYQASELLDDRTCDPCAAIDGKVYANLEEAEADYAAGGFVDCEGGPNCRGTLVAVHDEQNPKGGEGPLNEPEPPYDRPSGEAEEPIPGEPEIPGVETPEGVAIDESAAIETGEDVSSFLEGVDYPAIPMDFGRLDDIARSRSTLPGLALDARAVLQETAQALADVKAKLGPDATRIDAIVPNSKRAPGEELDRSTFAAVAYVPLTREQRLIVNDREVGKLADKNLAAAHTGQLSKATFDTYGRTLHEMGHVYLNNVPGVPAVKGAGEVRAARIMREAGLGPSVREDGNLISRYSLENTHEGFAEIFATLMRPGAVDYDYGAGDKAVDERVKRELRDFHAKWNAEAGTYAKLPPIEKGPPQPAPPEGITEGKRGVGRPPQTRLVREAREGQVHGLSEIIPALVDLAKADLAGTDVTEKVLERSAEWGAAAAKRSQEGADAGAGEKELPTKEAADHAKEFGKRISEDQEKVERIEEALDVSEVAPLWRVVLATLAADLIVVTKAGPVLPEIDPAPGSLAARVSGTTFIPEGSVARAGSPANLARVLRREYGRSVERLLGAREGRLILELLPEPGDEVAPRTGLAELLAIVTDSSFDRASKPGVAVAGDALMRTIGVVPLPEEAEPEEEPELTRTRGRLARLFGRLS